MARRSSPPLPRERAPATSSPAARRVLPVQPIRARRDGAHEQPGAANSSIARRSRAAKVMASSAPQAARGWSRWGVGILVVLVLGGLLVARRAGDALWRRHYASQIAATWETAPVDALDSSMLQLRLLGEPGWGLLVEALAHSRPEVQQAARQHLTLELDAWRELDSAESSRRVDQLSEHLHDMLPQLSIAGRRYAGTLATEMLVWPLDSDEVDPLQVVMRCEAILRARLEAVVLPQEPLTDEASQESETPAASDALEGAASRERRDSSPDGWDVAMLGDSEGPASPLPMLNPLLEASLLPPGTSDSETVISPNAGEEMTEPGRAVGPESPPAVISPRTPASTPERSRSWGLETRETHWQLLQRLHASDRIEQERAEAELKRRGFTSALLEVGREISAPDPARRLAVVESLRTRRQLDPIPWLKQAAKDDDLEVRRAALLALMERGDAFEAQTAQRRLDQLPREAPLMR